MEEYLIPSDSLWDFMMMGKERKVYDMTIAVIYKDDEGGFSYYYIIE